MPERWDLQKRENVERADVDKFIEDILGVCREHEMSLAHEERHGAFIVEPLADENIEWLRGAMINRLSASD